jgi:hypothetical protein
MSLCLGCHEKVSAPTKCDTCHAEKPGIAQARTSPWEATHGSQWRNSHGMMSPPSECMTCHASDSCVKCHGVGVPHSSVFASAHGPYASSKDARCTTCHSQRDFCDDCHGLKLPHPKGYLADHAKIAKGYEDPLCMACHEGKACSGCHDRHVHPGNINKFRDPAEER